MELAAKGIVLGGDLDAIDIGCAGSSAEDVVGDGSGPVVRIGVQGCLRLIVGVETFILRNQIGAIFGSGQEIPVLVTRPLLS